MRLIRRSSKDDTEWAGFAGSRAEILEPADSQHRPQAIRAACFLAGVAAAACLWAVLFGDAIPGLKFGATLDNADSLPNANLAFAAAIVIYIGSPFAAWWWAGFAATRDAPPKWLGLTAIAGAILFGLSRMFV